MARWTEVLDHGDDPGRFTIIYGKGFVVLANSDGSVICRRKVFNPGSLVYALRREPGVGLLSPKYHEELLKKVNQHLIIRNEHRRNN